MAKPVSQFLVDKLSTMDFVMNYIKGPDNIVADALSRFPMLGPRILRRKGTKVAMKILLSSLTNSEVPLQRTWFNAGKDTKYLANMIFDWRQSEVKQRAKPAETMRLRFTLR